MQGLQVFKIASIEIFMHVVCNLQTVNFLAAYFAIFGVSKLGGQDRNLEGQLPPLPQRRTATAYSVTKRP